MRKQARKFAAVFAVSVVAIVAAAPVASGEPKPFSGYYKSVNGGGNGESECTPSHQGDLPQGQAKKC